LFLDGSRLSTVGRMTTIAPPQRRTGLFTAAALANVAVAVASPVSTIVAADRLAPAWGGLPNAACIIGTGAGAAALTRVFRRHGHRAGLTAGYGCAAAGMTLAGYAVLHADVAGLVLGMLLLGVGNAAALLSRYTVAEFYPEHRRGHAIGLLVWAAGAGAIGGPLLLTPAGAAAGGLGWPAVTGPLAVAAVACAVAAASATKAPTAATETRTTAPLATLLAARTALAVLVTAQVVMAAVMTAAPLHMHLHHGSMAGIGVALAAHTAGMFVLSPLTGRLTDRLGPRPVMLAGLLTMGLSTALAAVGGGAVALFGLGLGWNLCFVAGSSQLARDVPLPDRMRIEGTVDSIVWVLAAVAGLGCTVVLAVCGFAALAVGAGLLVLPAAVLVLISVDG
jgi:MFS family permease